MPPDNDFQLKLKETILQRSETGEAVAPGGSLSGGEQSGNESFPGGHLEAWSVHLKAWTVTSTLKADEWP